MDVCQSRKSSRALVSPLQISSHDASKRRKSTSKNKPDAGEGKASSSKAILVFEILVIVDSKTSLSKRFNEGFGEVPRWRPRRALGPINPPNRDAFANLCFTSSRSLNTRYLWKIARPL